MWNTSINYFRPVSVKEGGGDGNTEAFQGGGGGAQPFSGRGGGGGTTIFAHPLTPPKTYRAGWHRRLNTDAK